MTYWTFLTSHGLVLIYISAHPASTAREIAVAIGITERTVHRVIADLEQEGYIQRHRDGRRNMYVVNHDARMKHDITRDTAVGDLVSVINPNKT